MVGRVTSEVSAPTCSHASERPESEHCVAPLDVAGPLGSVDMLVQDGPSSVVHARPPSPRTMGRDGVWFAATAQCHVATLGGHDANSDPVVSTG
eukprot:2918420-Rhodomonas_salina.3